MRKRKKNRSSDLRGGNFEDEHARIAGPFSSLYLSLPLSIHPHLISTDLTVSSNLSDSTIHTNVDFPALSFVSYMRSAELN